MEDCIKWEGHVEANGYGRKMIRDKQYSAHRLAYCAEHGVSIESIKGLEVMHICDNPTCVNPKHLRLGTRAENAADMVAKNRQAKGERVGGAKLTASDVLKIRSSYVRGNGEQLAKQYGVTRQAIRWIVKRKNWYWL